VKVECKICGKRVSRMKVHKKWSHPDGVETREEETLDDGTGLEGTLAKLLYSEVVKPLCEGNGIKLKDWEDSQLDKQDYFTVAGKILKQLIGDDRQ